MYGAFVLMIVAAAFRAGSRYFEIAAIILSFLWIGVNTVYFLVPGKTPTDIFPILNGFAGAYFLVSAFKPNAQHRTMHMILGLGQIATLALNYMHLLSRMTDFIQVVPNHWWLTFAINRVFDVMLLTMIIFSRIRIHVDDPNRSYVKPLFSTKK